MPTPSHQLTTLTPYYHAVSLLSLKSPHLLQPYCPPFTSCFLLPTLPESYHLRLSIYQSDQYYLIFPAATATAFPTTTTTTTRLGTQSLATSSSAPPIPIALILYPARRPFVLEPPPLSNRLPRTAFLLRQLRVRSSPPRATTTREGFGLCGTCAHPGGGKEGS
ncbi:hypothetical protein BAUCODRAFT_333316 [Baudoinia panamericana UAMH 10762]|uniref:Uncharacterized protein n=1 Tax=Baudoinia panamericana (strain UAMH 10762) TaxID=717646 RepID=M2MXR8_BAUPA|nr:uncharacterized protein BAUCODRAFT_333316 [Baudoinia panamericana UAMH 10762]EMC91035.1 hypothetical protein BAUCODRAFT_333316 [Baudoinia panamericana UAMH 10762]